VTQVPALVIAVGTGIIVTRSSSDTNLSQEILRQVTSFPKTLLLVAVAIGGIGLLPGIPVVQTSIVLGLILAIAFAAYRFVARSSVAEPAHGTGDADDGGQGGDPHMALLIEPIEVQVGRTWAREIDLPDSVFMERVAAFRTQHAQDLGLVLPRIRFKDSGKVGAECYEISIDGVVLAKGEARLEQLLAIHASGDTRSLVGEPTKDPTYGLPALWINPAQREAAIAAKFTLVDGPTVFLTHLTEVLRRESATLLTRAETDKLLARVRQTQPGLVEELIPTVLAVSDVQKVLQALLREKVSIRHMDAILETLADAGRTTKDIGQLVELVRQRLGAAICRGLTGESTILHVMTLDPAIESQFLASLQASQATAGGFAMEPKLAERFVSRMVQAAEQMMKSNQLPVLLCSPELRRHVRALTERIMPHLRVLSMVEVPQFIELRSQAVVTV
jgi:flagellar biosynthesis protein FlhA